MHAAITITSKARNISHQIPTWIGICKSQKHLLFLAEKYQKNLIPVVCSCLIVCYFSKTFHRQQHIQNAAARLITYMPMHEHVCPILMQLHWLPIKKSGYNTSFLCSLFRQSEELLHHTSVIWFNNSLIVVICGLLCMCSWYSIDQV